MVGRKEKIIFLLSAAIVLCLLRPAIAAAQSLARGKEEIATRQMRYNKKINFGIKGGFRSTTYIVSDLLIAGQRVEDPQKNYLLGYYAALFTRFNFKRRFLQAEISYNIDRAEVLLNKGIPTSSSTPIRNVTSNIQSISFPLMCGFYIVRNGPYTLSVFLGPKAEYIVKSNIDYENFEQQNIKEKLHPLNLAIVSGISVSISKVFFDFRYEQETMNISKSVNYDPQANESGAGAGNIKFHRRGSSLSFSFGVLF